MGQQAAPVRPAERGLGGVSPGSHNNPLRIASPRIEGLKGPTARQPHPQAPLLSTQWALGLTHVQSVIPLQSPLPFSVKPQVQTRECGSPVSV